MNCLSATVKYILYILNVVFLAGGIFLICVGAVALSDMGNFSSFDEAVKTQTIPIIVLVLGCIIFLISFFGCCGTIRENACCTSIYAISMFVLFCLQLALTIWILVDRSEFLDKMSDIVKSAWNENNSAKDYPMDALQLAFKCCGENSYADYNGTVPASCCGYSSRNQSCAPSIYTQRPGCEQKFTDFWAKNIDMVCWGGLGIAIFELILGIISCCLAGQMRSR